MGCLLSYLVESLCETALLFARGITYLSLASTTSGQLLAKTIGSVLLLQVMDWRKVARVGAL
jgi:hypothetical protein